MCPRGPATNNLPDEWVLDDQDVTAALIDLREKEGLLVGRQREPRVRSDEGLVEEGDAHRLLAPGRQQIERIAALTRFPVAEVDALGREGPIAPQSGAQTIQNRFLSCSIDANPPESLHTAAFGIVEVLAVLALHG